MTPAIREFLLAVSDSLAASIIAKVTITTALGLLAAWVARGNRAAVRHALLAAMFVVVLLLPVATVFLPPFHVGVPIKVENWNTLPLLGAGLAPDTSTMSSGGTHVATVAPDVSVSLSEVLFAGWGTGVMLFLLPVIVGLWQIGSLRRSGLPWRYGQLLVEPLALEAGIHRRVEVLLHEAVPGPMTCGVLRPAIVLPQDAENWNPEDLSRAMVHELEHVRRGDSMSRCLARFACALYWFQPLIWIAWRKLVLEAERSSDDAVLRRSDATAYADQLVGLAKRLSVAHRSPALAMANRADLAIRVGAVLDSHQRRGRAGMFSVALTCSVAAALVIAMSPLKLVGAPQSSQPERSQFEVASIKLNTSGSQSTGMHTSPDGSIRISNMSLMNLVLSAYEVHYFQVSGGPGWLRSEHYDIAAKAPPGSTPRQIPQMIQSLLEERFRLRLRREDRDMPIYSLRVGKGGARFEPTKEGSCVTDPVSAAKDVAKSCGYNMLGRTTFDMLMLPMRNLTDTLSRLTGRQVVDETGLTGNYSLHLDFAPPDSTPTQADDSSLPSIFTAVEEQLGLRLESSRGPVGVLVIEGAEKPTEN